MKALLITQEPYRCCRGVAWLDVAVAFFRGTAGWGHWRTSGEGVDLLHTLSRQSLHQKWGVLVCKRTREWLAVDSNHSSMICFFNM